jgi:Lrp/AsnC family transcriptional regulator for asnA, asnC and gidA
MADTDDAGSRRGGGAREAIFRMESFLLTQLSERCLFRRYLPVRKIARGNMKKTLDPLDKHLISPLREDGRVSLGTMAARLGVTAPTVRTRIKALRKAGLLRVAGLVDPHTHHDLTLALVGLSIRSYGKVDEILEKLARLDNGTWVAVVTGRYDAMAEVVVRGGMEDLYRLTTDVIPEAGDIVRSETFVLARRSCS